MSGYLVGLDVGHTLIKAAIFDVRGRAFGAGTRPVDVSRPHPHWQERDLLATWHAVAAAIRDAVADAGLPASAIQAVGLAGHGDGMYLVDAQRRPVRAGILATDSRAAGYRADWQTPPVAGRLLALTGQLPEPYAPACLLSWLRDHEPDSLERTAYLLFCKDWIRLRLTGVVATDPTDAAAGLCDVRARQWSLEALASYGLAEFRGLLPEIQPSKDVIGAVTPEAAEQTGLAPGTPVITGCHDVHSAALGIGALADGALSSVLGTFNINQIATTTPRTSRAWQTRCSIVDDLYLSMATSPGGAAAVDWVRGITGLTQEPVSTVVGRALATPIGSDDPMFLPFVHGSRLTPAVGGAFLGLGGWHGPDDLVRAALEGVAYEHRLQLTALAPLDQARAGRIRLTGGGSRSTEWSQLLADMTGLRVEVTDTHEAGARGAAMLAGVGIGLLEDPLDAARRWVQVIRVHVPRAARAGLYDDRFVRWRTAIEALQVGAESGTKRAAPGRYPASLTPGRSDKDGVVSVSNRE